MSTQNSHLPVDEAVAILAKLVGFKTVSATTTGPILDYISDYLAGHGIEAVLSLDETGTRANLFATIGPEVDAGVVLSGHTDVVPVTGQNWATDPFELTEIDGKLFGRGSVDMKGFIACALASVPMFKSSSLQKPIHLAWSFDEEIGGLGMPILLDAMTDYPMSPEIVIVGEPTNMRLVTGHKGGYDLRAEITGHAVHSCDPTKGVNAIAIAGKLIGKIEEIAARVAANLDPASAYIPPYTTFNIGTIEGGAASNATAGWCNFTWEFRPLPGDDGAAIIAEVEAYARDVLLPDMRAVHPETDIRIITSIYIPALDDRNAARAAEFVTAITGQNDTEVVSFGTDGGYYSDAGFSTVVFGPGDISRAHKPDEYITRDEIAQGLEFLEQVGKKLAG